jgi:hypothetical protein
VPLSAPRRKRPRPDGLLGGVVAEDIAFVSERRLGCGCGCGSGSGSSSRPGTMRGVPALPSAAAPSEPDTHTPAGCLDCCSVSSPVPSPSSPPPSSSSSSLSSSASSTILPRPAPGVCGGLRSLACVVWADELIALAQSTAFCSAAARITRSRVASHLFGRFVVNTRHTFFLCCSTATLNCPGASRTKPRACESCSSVRHRTKCASVFEIDAHCLLSRTWYTGREAPWQPRNRRA